jgi:hypothetical protein
LDFSFNFLVLVIYCPFYLASQWLHPEIDPFESQVRLRPTRTSKDTQLTLPGCSGAATDRRHAMAMLAANHPNDPVDVIMGDWMSEAVRDLLCVALCRI